MHECPDQCSGRRSDRQYRLTDKQREELPQSAQDRIGKESASVYRCTYCGCVYLRKPEGNIRLGVLDGGITGPGWHNYKAP